jgi:HAD superfamily hydrolase (TIGR01509 family)
MNEIKGAIFDLDGTLIDSMKIWTEVDKIYLGKRGIPVPKNLFADAKGGNSFLEVAAYFKEKFSLPDTIEEIVVEWTDLVQDHYVNHIPLKPGVREFLDLLKENSIKIGVGTSNSLVLANKVLISNGIIEYFDTIVTGCQEIKGKPFPDIFLKVAEQLDIEPQHCLVCEDVLAGVQAGVNAGMHVIAIYDSFSAGEAREMRALADFYGNSFYEIIDYCSENNVI